MVCASWRLSIPLPMVALPCGSRSTSARCLVAARLARDYTRRGLADAAFLVGNARIAIALTHRTEQNQMTRGTHARHCSGITPRSLNPRQLSQFFMRVKPFIAATVPSAAHRRPASFRNSGRSETARQITNRTHAAVATFRRAHRTSVLGVQVRRGWHRNAALVIAAEQRHADCGHQRKRDPRKPAPPTSSIVARVWHHGEVIR